MTEASWAIIRSRTRCEDIVAQGFLNAGYRAYVPHFRVLSWPHGAQRKPAATMRALFSGLVFVQDWRGWPKDRISHIIGLMPSPKAGVPAMLSGTDIAILMDRERLGQFELHAPRPPANGFVIPHVAVGEQVEFELAGQMIEGVLRDLSPDGRATISAAMFGGTVDVRVNAADLRTAG